MLIALIEPLGSRYDDILVRSFRPGDINHIAHALLPAAPVTCIG